MRTEKILKAGNRYADNLKFSKALEAYKLSLNVNPYSIPTWIEIGRTYFQIGDYDKAEKAIARAITLDPNYYYPWRKVGWFSDPNDIECLRLGGTESIKKNISIAWLEKGRIRNQVGDNPMAIIYLRRAVDIDSENYEAWKILGDFSLQNEYVEESKKYYEESLKINEDYAASWDGLGYTFLLKGKYTEAIEFFKKAIKISPNIADFWNNLGLAYKEKKLINKSILAFKKAIEINSKLSQGWKNLGDIYKSVDAFEKAIEHYQIAYDLDPDMESLLVEIGTLHAINGDYEIANNYFQKALLINPKSVSQRLLDENKFKIHVKQLKEQGESQLYEAKVIILGSGEAGKTTLVKKIKDPNYIVPCLEPSTHGIQIYDYSFQESHKVGDIEFVASIWDFGGQEIYHSTHQFFLTNRSLYILVIDSRTEENDFDYWLHISSTLGQGSPLIIVINEKEDHRRDLDLASIRKIFPFVIDYIKVNFATNRGLDGLKKKLQEELFNLPHVGQRLPKKWVNIRTKLERIKNQYISLSDYLKICEIENIYKESRALMISSFLHDLGVILHFQNDVYLKNTLILNPEWITNSVYKIFDSQIIQEKNGRFDLNDLQEVWSSQYPVEKYPDLLRLLKKFQICYQIDDLEDLYIAPQLLSEKPPKYALPSQLPIQLQIYYPFLPKGIINRFMVEIHDKIKFAWKNGVVINDQDGTLAEVIQNKFNRVITIKVFGNNSKEFLYLIRSNLKRINRSFGDLQFSEKIPCICPECKEDLEPMLYNMEVLEKAMKKGKGSIECHKSLEFVSIKHLTEALQTTENTITELKNFISLADFKKFFQAIKNYAKGSELENDIIQLNARYSLYKNKITEKTMSTSEESMFINQITNSSLLLIDKFEELNNKIP